MPERTRVLAIVYESENDTLHASSIMYGAKLGQLGYQVEIIDLRQAENFSYLHKSLASGEIAFAFGLQGVGSRLHVGKDNLWTMAKVPFISIHYDHPSHAITNHITESPYIVNLYNYGCFLDDYKKYVTPIRGEKRLAGVLPIESATIDAPIIPLKDREIKYLYMKSWVTLDPYIEHFNTLPKELREGVWDRINEAIKNPNLSLCDLAESLFNPTTFRNPETQVEFWAIVRAMDLYIRHKRAIEFIEWLKQQDGAVIYGNGWESVKDAKTKAVFMKSVPFGHVWKIISNSQFVCNTNPYGRDMIHERTILGLYRGGHVITDTNAWTEQKLGDLKSVVRFNWTAPIEDQVRGQIDNAPDMGDGRERYVSLFIKQGHYEQIVRYANATQDFVDSLNVSDMGQKQ